jgi:hypothetical protein
MDISLKSIYSLYDALQKLDQAEIVESAICREQAQEILATPTIPLKLRQMIAERLNQVNQQLAMKTVGSEDSY